MTLLATLFGCSNKTYNKTVDFVDRDRFMQDWYVQAGRFTPFEKDPYNSIESYRWNEKEQQIDIRFSYNQGSLTGEKKEIPQTGWVHNTKTNAHWKVRPWWPLKFDYLIIALDKVNYEWTAIGVPDEKYLWVMTKTPQFPRDKVQEILKEVAASGYSIKDIKFVEHSRP